MAAIITEKFRQHNANKFYESFSGTGNTTYYFFIGKTNTYIAADNNGVVGVSDSVPPVPADDVTTEFYTWDSMIAAKRINSTDIKYVVSRRNFGDPADSIYDMYRDNVRGITSTDSTGQITTNGYTNLWDSDFCFVTSEYKVYVVLYNDQGNAYTGTEPTTVAIEPFWNGNYLFKYLYTITPSEIDRFYTTNFIPVPTVSELTARNDFYGYSNNLGNGKIHVVDVINAGSGYTYNGNSSPSNAFYTPIKGDGTGAIMKFYISGGQITPFGDGTSSNVTSVIDSVTVGVENTGYTYGYVDLTEVYSDSTLSTSVSITTTGNAAVVKPIIPPTGGHGGNPVAELGAHFVMLNIQLNQSEGDDITINNDFRQLGILIDPYNYGTSSISSDATVRQTYAINFSGVTGSFIIDEKISQTVPGGTAVGRVVDWDSVNNILYYVQERHVNYGVHTDYNYFAFTGNQAVQGSDSGSSGVIDTSNTTVTLPNQTTISFVAGYCNPELQPDSGSIIYLENRKPISRAEDQTEDIKITIEF